MMASDPSALSLAASGIYSIVVMACAFAAATAWRGRQAAGHGRTWAMIALLFAVLIALRLLAAEEWLRDMLRGSLQASGEYADRRAFQAPIVAAILAVAALGILLALHRLHKRYQGRRNTARLFAILAAASMIFLIALRLASLHAFDALLYGPLKLNWVIDLGSSFVVMVAALRYVRLVRARP